MTYEGQPVRDVAITLRPATGTARPAAAAEIIDGKYDIPEKGGPPLGTYRATLTVIMHRGPRTGAGPRQIPEMCRFEQDVEFEDTEQRQDFDLPP